MPSCIECGSYTKFEEGLCYKCYKKDGDGNGNSKSAKTKSNGKHNESWVYNLIKGRTAETLVEELFLSLNFQVFKYGMENTIPGIKDLLREVKDEIALEIKRMPDFVVFKNEKAHFIEVKFRARGGFKLADVDAKGKYPYRNACL